MSRVYIFLTFFKYFGPAETQGNPLYQCLKWPLLLDSKEKPTVLYSWRDKSRNNLKSEFWVAQKLSLSVAALEHSR
jgi:hypothetical protein